MTGLLIFIFKQYNTWKNKTKMPQYWCAETPGNNVETIVQFKKYLTCSSLYSLLCKCGVNNDIVLDVIFDSCSLIIYNK